MKTLLFIHIVFSGIFILMAAFLGTTLQTRSFALGSFISIFNVVAIYFSWSRILNKKSIALAIGVIVIKYAILTSLIYYLASSGRIALVSFAMGVASLVVVGVVWAPLMMRRFKKV